MYIYNLAKVKLSLVGSLAMLALVVRVNQDSAWPLCLYTVRLMLVVLVSQSALDWREKGTTSLFQRAGRHRPTALRDTRQLALALHCSFVAIVLLRITLLQHPAVDIAKVLHRKLRF